MENSTHHNFPVPNKLSPWDEWLLKQIERNKQNLIYVSECCREKAKEIENLYYGGRNLRHVQQGIQEKGNGSKP